MVGPLLALLLLALCFLEISLQADLHHFDSTSLRLILRCGGLHKTWLFSLLHTPQGLRLILRDEHIAQPVTASEIRSSRTTLLLNTLRRADKARHFLLRRTHLDRLDGLALLRTEDAARSALVSGAVQGALGCIPAVRRHRVRFRVLPEFFRAHSTVQVRCIIRLRVGTILLTGMMLLAATIRERQQMKARQSYGTSHW